MRRPSARRPSDRKPPDRAKVHASSRLQRPCALPPAATERSRPDGSAVGASLERVRSLGTACRLEGSRQRAAACRFQHNGEGLSVVKPPPTRAGGGGFQAVRLPSGCMGGLLMKGAILPKTSRRQAESEMTENAVECAVCKADPRPSRASIVQSAWSRNPRARFRARRVRIRPRFRSSAAWDGCFQKRRASGACAGSAETPGQCFQDESCLVLASSDLEISAGIARICRQTGIGGEP